MLKYFKVDIFTLDLLSKVRRTQIPKTDGRWHILRADEERGLKAHGVCHQAGRTRTWLWHLPAVGFGLRCFSELQFSQRGNGMCHLWGSNEVTRGKYPTLCPAHGKNMNGRINFTIIKIYGELREEGTREWVRVLISSCHLGHATWTLWPSASSSVKWGQHSCYVKKSVLNRVKYMKHLEECLAHSKYLISVFIFST